jgi:addiction module RelE/StbE family toxin
MKVVYRREALADLDRIFTYIARDRPNAAGHVVERIRSSIGRLEMFPYSGRQGSVEGTYELVVSRLPYIAVYRVTDSVEIVAVFHAAQDRDGEKAE